MSIMKKIIYSALAIMSGLFYGCSSNWLEIKPKGEADIIAIQSAQGVNVLLIGAYAVVDGTHRNYGDGAVWASAVSNWVWGGVASDDAYKGSNYGDQSTINPIEGFYADANNGYVINHWFPLYDGVLRANDVLKALPLAADMKDADKKLAEAQAKFLRAHFYVELTRVHGKVPYIDEKTVNPSVVPNDHLLWPEIEADLTFAAANLPATWSDKGRATKWAAKTYLGYVYMFEKKYDLAKAQLDDVYTNGGFTLMSSFERNFMIADRNNTESIFEIQYAVNDGSNGSGNGGWGDALNYPYGHTGTCCGFYQPSHSLVAAYRTDATTGLPLLDETYTVASMLPYDPTGKTVKTYANPVDPRLDHTVGRPGIPYLDWGVQDGATWVRDLSNGGPYLNKKNMFKQSEKSMATSTGWATGVNANNFRKFRKAHVILWLAECEAQAGNLARATSLVNEIRNRAKGSNVVKLDDGTPAANYKVEPYATTFASKEYALKAIKAENRLEFAMEGMRFFELVRWGDAATVLNNYLPVDGTQIGALAGKKFTVGQHEIWPIPQQQIDMSLDAAGKSVLKQNTGY